MYRITQLEAGVTMGRRDAWPSVDMVNKTLCPCKECVGLLWQTVRSVMLFPSYFRVLIIVVRT